MQQAREWIASAGAIVALTGAGISAESGVPTFRGAGGLWRRYRPEQLATPEAFAREPRLVWEWYDWRRQRIAEAQPNAAHFALARLEARVRRFTLVTQNVDGLHDLAGSRAILKLHGDIWVVRCTGCGREETDRRTPLPELPPRCACGKMLRPGVVWFGEALPPLVWERAEEAVSQCDVLLVVGTSAVVYPAAGLIPLAMAKGAKVIEVNLQESEFSARAAALLRGKAGEVLPQLIA